MEGGGVAGGNGGGCAAKGVWGGGGCAAKGVMGGGSALQTGRGSAHGGGARVRGHG
jgi:hypothetical protein